ncbi:MAG: hypothetical protein HUJ77_10540 [Clostridium sp.]|uniref:hypothetical protein n=1 Tax=Clostridium sp. TaxID=1506 RepID=UPI0025C0A4C9|nr:hypothetical protein [Clostridium sp.]MCF0148818.1 hypothetical protein [Clostridium sp.]
MKNIINLLKYNFGKYHMSKSKIFYIIGLIILCFNFIGMFTKIPFLSEIVSLLNVGFVVTFLSINFVWQIVRFQTQISKEKGKLLFTFPIKSNEFMIAKIIEFIIIQGIIVLITNLVSLISGNSLGGLVNLSSTAVMYGTVIAYIIIISFMVICSSYIYNTALAILTVIIGGSIVQGIVEGIIKIVTNLLPYIYMRIGARIEIDLLYSLLSLAWVIFIVYLAIYHLDKKLDII